MMANNYSETWKRGMNKKMALVAFDLNKMVVNRIMGFS